MNEALRQLDDLISLFDVQFSGLMPQTLARKTPVIHIPSLLSSCDIHTIFQFAEECSLDPTTFSERSDGHIVTFLHSRMESSLPKLYDKLISRMQMLDFHGVLKGQQWSVRCIEFHKYEPGSNLLDFAHLDQGSLLTLSIAMNEPHEDFEGGQFMTWECDDSLRFWPAKKGDGLLFVSHKYHCVKTVSRGTRYSLVIELWPQDTNRTNRMF